MKKFIVIGNPIEHSISPKVHNYWFKENNIEATYSKKLILEDQLENFVEKIRKKEINGANVTVPYKEKIIPFLDSLSDQAKEANSVNTLYLLNDKVVGDNTDIGGFFLSIKNKGKNFENKSALIFGSGGVAPSIILALRKLGLKKIIISNRTKEKALKLKEKYNFLEILEWGKTLKADIVINTTSLGLNKNDIINIDFSVFDSNTFFYDVIYNPIETNFLKNAKKKGFLTENGLMMFLNQASAAFNIWHNVEPEINQNLLNFIKND